MKRKRSSLIFPDIEVKPSIEQEALAFLKKFVEANRQAVTSDEEINGADCVDYFCQLWHDAEKITRRARS